METGVYEIMMENLHHVMYMYGLEMLVFQEGGKTEDLYPQNKESTNNILKPHIGTLARILDFRTGDSKKRGRRGWYPGRRVRTISKFQVLGNAISTILRQSQCVSISNFFLSAILFHNKTT